MADTSLVKADIPATAPSVGTALSSNGTPQPESPYLDIVADLLFILHGDDDMVNVTPLLQMAAMACELELAERLLDESLLAEDDGRIEADGRAFDKRCLN